MRKDEVLMWFAIGLCSCNVFGLTDSLFYILRWSVP